MSRAAALLALLALAAPRPTRAGPPDGTTVGVMAGSAALLLTWDVYLATRGARTESSLLAGAGWKSDVLPYSLGVLLGHWFLQRPEAGPRRAQLPLVLGSVAAVAAFDLAWSAAGGPRRCALRYPGLWAGIGFAAGGLFWSQSW